MKISLNWLSEYLDVAPIRADLKGVLGKLTMRGLEVESIHDLSKGFDKVIIAHVDEREKHPNSDRLSLCRVNTGAEVLQIVCGAQNVRAGEKVVLSMIGAHLPNGLKIEKGKIRDVESFGMLCSETELGLADESEGILLLPKDAPVGKPLAPYIGRDDIIFSLNVTPNRGDALSHLGVARELAAILGQKLKRPEPKLNESNVSTAEKIKVSFSDVVSTQNLCLQYHARYIEGVKVGPSPDWLKKRLQAIGLRPINNVVDVTNFVLMEYGQPLHAFDYDQIHGKQIQVRLANKGEKLPLLDGTEVELSEKDLVIADGERAIALAGVMGGGNSEVTDKTTSILLEAAQFSSAAVRFTARRHQKHSDSSHRFERQIDPVSVVRAMDRAAALIVELAGGKIAKQPVGKLSPLGEKTRKEPNRSIAMSIAKANRFLGVNLTGKQIQDCLLQVGFESELKSDQLLVKAPSYRPDVEVAEDTYEEILRVWGYDQVESRVPRLEFIPDPANSADHRFKQIQKLKTAFVEHGFSEVLNFAFTSKASNTRWGGEDTGSSVDLQNPLNEDFSTLKTSLIGGMLENLVTAVRHQQSEIRLFEVRPVYLRDEKSETGVREEWRVGMIATGRAYTHALAALDRKLDFFDLKGILEIALETVGTRGIRFMPASEKADARLHPAQCAKIAIGKGPCGFLARLHPRIESEFKLREPVYLAEFSLDRALEIAKPDRKYSPISKFPKVERDLSLLTPDSMSAEKVLQTVQKLGRPLLESVAVVDLYKGDKLPTGTQSLSISFVLGDLNRTLEDKEVDAMCQKIMAGLDKELGVKLRQQ